MRRSGLIAVGLAGTAVLLFLLKPVVFQESRVDHSKEFNNQLVSVYRDLYSGYMEPERNAAQAVVSPCKDVEPGFDNVECSNLVGAIRLGDPVLISSVDRLDSLLAEVPSDVPSSMTSPVSTLTSVLKQIHQSNVLLVEGWAGGDKKSWARGWAIRESLGEIAVPTGQVGTP